MYSSFGKRLLDLVIAILALTMLAPLLGLVALLVRTKLGRPILFRQRRAGLGGVPFTLFKFRTMNDARDAEGELLPDEERLTRFGRVLRATSLDELPELINVLKSEMSLVGPRPLLLKYLELYTPEQFRRHKTLPGITGWAQINGRNAVTWEQKFEMDVWYVDNRSFQLDLKIIALTILKIVLREGISQAGHATAQEFKGSIGKGA
jgi:sugar transferase EpsL